MEKEREDGAKPIIIAHRGASGDAPENTLAAFNLAWEQGADGMECDVHQAQDHHIVCIHDSDTKRVSNESLEVSQSKVEALKQLDVGSWKGLEWKGERIPTLVETLEAIPSEKLAVVEIKTGPSILPAFYQVLERSSFDETKLIVISFDAEVIHQLKEDSPQIKAYWLTAFMGNKPEGFKPGVKRILDTLSRIGADGLGAQNHEAVNEELVEALKNAEMELNIWTVDEIAEAKRYQELGVSSISTNFPARIIEGLRDR